MRIVQIVLDGAPEYERKSQRVDYASLTAQRHAVRVALTNEIASTDAAVAHVYGPRKMPASLFVRFPIPYIASGTPRPRRFASSRPVNPGYVVSPLQSEEEDLLPEAVEDCYFDAVKDRAAAVASDKARRSTIGTFGPHRTDVAMMIEQTLSRIHRFRDDVSWRSFEGSPAPDELAALDLWVDPATDEGDFDGFVAEAVAAGVTVVASRTPINAQRLEQGRTGFLIPARDPNELAHAILTALFKPEVAQQKTEAARQTVAKFRARQRMRVLLQMYTNLTE